MQVHTIDDLKSMKKGDIQPYLDRVTILEDLQEWYQYLNKSGERTTISFDVDAGLGRKLCIHPSSACKKGVCPLQLYYGCTGEIQKVVDPSFELSNTFNIGTAMHSMLQTFFHDMYGEAFESEVGAVNEELHISGSMDGVFSFQDVRFILEIKTIKEGGSYGWEKVQIKPLEDNYRQTQIYMAVSGIPFALLVYFCKNNGKVKEHAITFDAEAWEDLRSVITPVVDAAYKGGPPVQGTPGGKCLYCDYSIGCPEYRRMKDAKTTSRVSRLEREAVRRTNLHS